MLSVFGAQKGLNSMFSDRIISRLSLIMVRIVFGEGYFIK